MSHLQYFTYPGFGEKLKQDTHYHQAVRLGNIIETSGQGGWDRETGALPSDLTTEIAQAFENVQETLVRAGGKGWSQVYSINGYFTVMDEEAIGLFVTELKKWCPDHQPILTGVQVQGLAFGMRVEIAVKAHLGEKE